MNIERVVLIATLLTVGQVSLGQMKPLTPWNPAKAIPCPQGAACDSCRQLVEARDEDVIIATWACFYDKSPEQDSFFIVWDGKLATTKSGKHPSIFIQHFANGTSPSGASGYGPISGQNWAELKEHSMIEFTYDDLGPEFQFSNLIWSSDKADAPMIGRTSTTIRKSTGRFVSKKEVFTGPMQETSASGICLRFKYFHAEKIPPPNGQKVDRTAA